MKKLTCALIVFSFLYLSACDFPTLKAERTDEQEVGSPWAWVKYPDNPVFVKSPPGQWDSEGVTCFSVRKFGSTLWMYYTGHRDSVHPFQIGVATSTDGISWARYPDSILPPGPPGSWDSKCVYGPDVILHQGRFLMLYVGQGDSKAPAIGLASSSDGYAYTKHPRNPVMPSGACLSVERDGDSLMMLYMNYNGFCRASSMDGINWVQYPGNPVLLPGDSTQWDEIIASPSLVILNGEYHLWYTGADTLGNARGKIQIGYASTTDRGCTWTKFPGNPVLTPTQPWEGKSLYSNNAVMSTTLQEMWYASAGFGYAYNYVGTITDFLLRKEQLFDLAIYPNPVREEMVLQITAPRVANFKIQIYDVNGRIQQAINPGLLKEGFNKIRISVARELSAGVYFVVVRLGNRNFVKNIIITK